MENLGKNEIETLTARVEQIKKEIERVKKEAVDIFNAKQKGHKFDKLPDEDSDIKKKIAAELLQRESEMLNIQVLIDRGGTKPEIDINRIKALVEEKGLKKQVRDILDKEKSATGYLKMAECDLACQNCVWCDTSCLTSCTSCVTCISDEVVGNLPGIPTKK